MAVLRAHKPRQQTAAASPYLRAESSHPHLSHPMPTLGWLQHNPCVLHSRSPSQQHHKIMTPAPRSWSWQAEQPRPAGGSQGAKRQPGAMYMLCFHVPLLTDVIYMCVLSIHIFIAIKALSRLELNCITVTYCPRRLFIRVKWVPRLESSLVVGAEAFRRRSRRWMGPAEAQRRRQSNS